MYRKTRPQSFTQRQAAVEADRIKRAAATKNYSEDQARESDGKFAGGSASAEAKQNESLHGQFHPGGSQDVLKEPTKDAKALSQRALRLSQVARSLTKGGARPSITSDAHAQAALPRPVRAVRQAHHHQQR